MWKAGGTLKTQCVGVGVGGWVNSYCCSAFKIEIIFSSVMKQAALWKKRRRKKEEDEEEKKKKGLGEEDALKSASYNIWYGDQIYLG